MPRFRGLALSVAATSIAWGAAAQDWSQVGALFENQCIQCHSGEYAPLGLSLDSYAAALAGGENGPVLLAGDVTGSPLYQRLIGGIEPRMPLTGPPFLSDVDLALVRAWIEAGLPDGEPAVVAGAAASPALVRSDGEVWFGDVSGIFLQRCARCHSDGSVLGAPPEGLRLSSLDRILEGGERAVVVPGNAGLSLVWRHAAGIEAPRMPFDGPPWLGDDQIALIAAWIDGGARDSEGRTAPVPTGREIRAEGVLTGDGLLDGGAFVIGPGARIEDPLMIGGRYEIRGRVDAAGRVVVERIRAR